MLNDRSFRIDDLDLEELYDQTHDQKLVDSFAHWINNFAPQIDDVIPEITSAFDETRLGDGIGLFQATGLDDYASDEELKQLRARDEKTDWRLIPNDNLEHCYAAPSFFDAQGFLFHLPAFLIAELNDKHQYGFINRLFCEKEHPEGWRRLLTIKQRCAIISAFQLIRDHPNYKNDRHQIDVAIQRLGKATTKG